MEPRSLEELHETHFNESLQYIEDRAERKSQTITYESNKISYKKIKLAVKLIIVLIIIYFWYKLYNLCILEEYECINNDWEISLEILEEIF